MLQALRHASEKLLIVAALILSVAHAASAQSGDVDYPTPVFSNELGGSISPRDLGDARLTRHFYAFRATEGDLIITVQSTYLFGSVDIFTARTLRPLTKVTLYGTSSPTTVTRSVYLRREETLILRVEGRTMTDTDAVYNVRFSGSFAPALADTARTPPATDTPPQASASTRRGQRTATGARIYVPEPEPTPTPETETETAERDAARVEELEDARPTATPERPSVATRRSTPSSGARRGTRSTTTPPRQPSTRRTTRGARGTRRTTTTPQPRADERGEEVASARDRRESDAAERDAAEPDADEAESSEPRRAAGPRLVIIAKSGETFERDMSTVRRVTIERGQIVVIGTDGGISRYPLANVQRMSIEP